MKWKRRRSEKYKYLRANGQNHRRRRREETESRASLPLYLSIFRSKSPTNINPSSTVFSLCQISLFLPFFYVRFSCDDQKKKPTILYSPARKIIFSTLVRSSLMILWSCRVSKLAIIVCISLYELTVFF